MVFRAVIVDLDGTLLNKDHKISPFTLETIQQLQEKSIPILFATGRPYPDVLHTIDACGLSGGYVITSNGARIHGPRRDIIFSRDLDANVVADLVQIKIEDTVDANEPQKRLVSTNFHRHDEWMTNYGMKQILEVYAESGFSFKEVDLLQCPHDGVHYVFYFGETENLRRVEEVLEARFAGKVEHSYSARHVLDAVPPGVNKGKAMKYVADIMGIDLNDIIAFGDGMNDLKMLQAAGKGCIMGNANPRLIEQLPNMEVIGTNDDDGVAKKLREVFHL